MSGQSRPAILVGLMLALLFAFAWQSTTWMLNQQSSARYAREDLLECERLASTIESLRTQPAVAAVEDMGAQELGQRIEAASRLAQVGPGAIERVSPQAGRRVGDSPYLAKPTQIVLRGVTLSQATTLLFHLTDNTGLTVKDIRLRTPHGEAANQFWMAEATLTYLIYAPTTPARRDRRG